MTLDTVLKGSKTPPKPITLLSAFTSLRNETTAPVLLVYVVTNALRHNPSLTPHDLEEAVQALYTIAIDYVPPTQETMTQAATTAKHLNITVHDASYLTLTTQINAPLITADTRLKGKASEHNIIRLDTL